jgi:hypothetical protein
MERFELKEEHIKLINRMYVYFDDFSYDGAPAIDSKRPYGNSSVAYDVYEILFGKEFDYDEHDEMPEELYEDLMKVHKETATALQIVLCTKSFEPGTYEKTSRYDSLSWKKYLAKREDIYEME